jgi:hypothetical protein
MVGSPLQHTIYAYSQSPCQFSKCTKSVHLLIDSQSRYCSLVKEQSSLHTQHVNREPFILKSLKRPWCQISTILVSRYSCKRHARSTVIPALSSCSSNRGYPDSIHRTHSSRSSSRAWTHCMNQQTTYPGSDYRAILPNHISKLNVWVQGSGLMFFFRCAQRGSYTQSFDNKQYLKCHKRRQKHTMHTGSPFHRSASELYQSSPSVERLVHTWWRICEKKGSSDHGGHARFRLQLLGNLSTHYSLHGQDTKYIYIWNHQFSP